MGDFDIAFQDELKYHSWSLYSVALLFIALRLYARWQRLGFRGYQTDDWAMILAGGLYTSLIVCLNVIAQGGGSNLYHPSEHPAFTEKEIEDRIKGSKIVLISEQSMLNVIYVCKACMLCIYGRLTLGLREELAVRILAFYILAGWIATQITFFTACRPFSGYWAVPPSNPQCTTFQNYAIIQAVFNLSSDTFMLLIPLPLVIQMHVPTKQKVLLILLFSMGIFVILAAILTKVYNLSDIYSPNYMLWYERESSVALYVTNIPMIWPLMRQWIPSLRPLSGPTLTCPYADPNKSSLPLTTHTRTAASTPNGTQTHRSIRHMLKLSSIDSIDNLASVDSNDSQERINGTSNDLTGIHMDVSIDITEERCPFKRGPDAEKGNVYDWDHEGGNTYTVEASGAVPAAPSSL